MTPGITDMSGFEAMFDAPTPVTPEQAAPEAPAFNAELVAMFMRAHGNEQLTRLLSGILAADIVMKNMAYEQEMAERQAVQERGDSMQAYQLFVEKDKSDDEKAAA